MVSECLNLTKFFLAGSISNHSTTIHNPNIETLSSVLIMLTVLSHLWGLHGEFF